MTPWPQGAVLVDVEALIVAARALDAWPDSPTRRRTANELRDHLNAYIDGLPEALQAPTSRRLVAALCGRSSRRRPTDGAA